MVGWARRSTPRTGRANASECDRGGRGPGVCEIRIREQAGAFRVLSVATFVSCVYVLHAFQKESQKTAPQALRVAAQRYGLIEHE